MLVVLLLGLCLAASAARAADSLTCTGRFPNPITEICWSCILPISIGSTSIANIGGQEDIANPSSPVCSCGVNPTVGLSIGFWEPARHVEAVRKPFCLASLGGIDLDPGIPAPAGARFTRAEGDGDGGSFYQAHFYVNPVLYWLEVVTDFPCLERGSFDLAYLTEVDPLWNDDELTLILNPEAVLFANPVAVAACAADCVAATAGFGFAEMFWCAGCQGGIYPLDGHVPYHMGGVRTAALLAQRLTAKMHRELLAWGWHGKAGPVRPVLPAGHGQDGLQDAADLPGGQHREGCRALLPALRPQHDRLGRRQGVPGARRGLRLHVVPQEELLCGLLIPGADTGGWPWRCWQPRRRAVRLRRPRPGRPGRPGRATR